jgi:hypothetical protein
MHCAGSDDGERTWRTPEGVHLDLRGLEPPEPMVAVLRAIDSGDAESVIIGHFDREPIFLYPELADRGWTYEVEPASCGGPDCGDTVKVRLVRLMR